MALQTVSNDDQLRPVHIFKGGSMGSTGVCTQGACCGYLITDALEPS